MIYVRLITHTVSMNVVSAFSITFFYLVHYIVNLLKVFQCLIILIDNLSDHEHICLLTSLNFHCVGFQKNFLRHAFRGLKRPMIVCEIILSCELYNINIPIDALLCNDISCNNLLHLQQLDKYATDITDCCLRVTEAVICTMYTFMWTSRW